MKLLALAALVFLPLFARGSIVMPQHGLPASNERFDWKELTP